MSTQFSISASSLTHRHTVTKQSNGIMVTNAFSNATRILVTS